jgi:hypothetical protein
LLCIRYLNSKNKFSICTLHQIKQKRLTLFLSSAQTYSGVKKTFITHQFVAFCQKGKEERKPRALLPFEVASISFDIRFLFFFFFRCIHCHCCYIFKLCVLSVWSVIRIIAWRSWKRKNFDSYKFNKKRVSVFWLLRSGAWRWIYMRKLSNCFNSETIRSKICSGQALVTLLQHIYTTFSALKP